ncbi:MAG: rod shape-determining protein MreC [Planctomycetota bacterium]|nr:MAG: rod shape-determining protein MreC [Planctomycetota bacterium]
MKKSKNLKALFYIFFLLAFPLFLNWTRGHRLFQSIPFFWPVIHTNINVSTTNKKDKKSQLLYAQVLSLKEKIHHLQNQIHQLGKIQPHQQKRFAYLPAHILFESSLVPFQSRVFLDCGRDSKVQKNYGVLYGNIVVGRVHATYPSMSQVQTIWEKGFKLSVRNQRTREVFLLETKKRNQVTLKFVHYDQPIQVGDLLVTTGEGDFFPPSLLVGRVVKIYGKEANLFLEVKIEPLASLLNLEDVLVVIPQKKGQLP